MAAVSVDALHRSENLNLQRFLLRKLGNPADAADAAQETYLRLVKALTTTDLEQPRLFLFHLARNVAANLGKRRRFEAGLFRSMTDLELSSVVDGRAQTETQVIAREQLRLVAAAIDGLPPRCRETFLLSTVEGLSNGAVAARLGVSRNMVEKHLIKALLHIRRACHEFF
ncbi:sigma-70 family RNA polymerase sigma factor (plasmid) [Methylobacterium sp. NMS14P]|uniref:RNA polymerase sigma factor n=1 Tax=Methylobacterium sp. NMS14P TaxID=2894310 RepID=UPI00235A41A7|nr:sigma-70 family RNA polymerase sigma factor [Methylobacterium sp. NMS14P]WCS28461.1 sigma-70 family RNA polymerase sigma factor [Methylobacterium sp. NMS14P]